MLPPMSSDAQPTKTFGTCGPGKEQIVKEKVKSKVDAMKMGWHQLVAMEAHLPIRVVAAELRLPTADLKKNKE